MVKGNQQKILDAFYDLAMQNPNEANLSMSDLAKKAGISRQAIYKHHFNSVDDIIKSIHESIDKPIYEMFLEYDTLENKDPFLFIADNIFPILYENRKWLKMLYSSSTDPYWTNYLKKIYTKWALENIKPNQSLIDLPDDFIISLLVHYVIANIEVWITQENPLPPQVFKEKFLTLVHSSLDQYISLDKDNHID
ncbi:TetR/AcrR family transcriptional regulator [Streptococcus anginosus]|uniref:TetR/AcrR family transcriptional regulator n=1 Tax=Streptococcus anginosus TaxID=1328 RepID=UPI00066DF60E|nr:TetR/AcrR family transcriptional regulator [Streptococcus anginosus]